jgi:hypothetical protein
MNNLEIRHFSAKRGWQWIQAGAALLGKNPVQFIIMLVALFAAFRLVLLIPYVGSLALLAMPIALVGMIEQSDKRFERGTSTHRRTDCRTIVST